MGFIGVGIYPVRILLVATWDLSGHLKAFIVLPFFLGPEIDFDIQCMGPQLQDWLLPSHVLHVPLSDHHCPSGIHACSALHVPNQLLGFTLPVGSIRAGQGLV